MWIQVYFIILRNHTFTPVMPLGKMSEALFKYMGTVQAKPAYNYKKDTQKELVMMRGIINRTIANIYEVPYILKQTPGGVKSTIADEGLYGQEFTVLDENKGMESGIAGEGDFIKIRTFYNYEGYVKKDEVILYGQEESDCCCKMQNMHDGGCSRIMKVWVCAAYADILAMPNVSSQRLLGVTRGAIMWTDCVSDEGYRGIYLNDGIRGYIKNSFIMPYKEPVSGDMLCLCDEEGFRRAVVDTAKSYLGTQYRWGGKTPLGIDCSGLTSMSYLLNGVIIFRDAKLKEGFPVHEIEMKDIKPGDLLYFPGHTAMYIGNCEYIHSTARAGSDGVVINSLSPTSSCYREDLAKNLIAVGSVF